MTQGELFKITSQDTVYWGIFSKSDKGYNYFFAVQHGLISVPGFLSVPIFPVPLFRFKKGTKIRRWKHKTFDRQICIYGLAVRDGVFCDRLTMSEKTAYKLSEQFKQIRINN